MFELPSCVTLSSGQRLGVFRARSVAISGVQERRNFAGDKRILNRAMLRNMIEEHLVPELAIFRPPRRLAWVHRRPGIVPTLRPQQIASPGGERGGDRGETTKKNQQFQ